MDLHSLIEKTVVGLGFEMVDLELSPKGRLIRIFIDNPARPRGVNVEDCAAVSNQLSRLLVVEEIDYDRLEVSSPGLDRPLRTLEHFERFIGREVQMKTRLPVGNRRNFAGTLEAVANGKIRLLVEGVAVEIDFEQVDKARLVPKFD